MLIPNTRRLIDLIVEKGLIKALHQLDKTIINSISNLF
jgi:hypothetical protein